MQPNSTTARRSLFAVLRQRAARAYFYSALNTDEMAILTAVEALLDLSGYAAKAPAEIAEHHNLAWSEALRNCWESKYGRCQSCGVWIGKGDKICQGCKTW